MHIARTNGNIYLLIGQPTNHAAQQLFDKGFGAVHLPITNN
jgi:hypothetical protein